MPSMNCMHCGKSMDRPQDLCDDCFEVQKKQFSCLVCGMPTSQGACLNTECRRNDMEALKEEDEDEPK